MFSVLRSHAPTLHRCMGVEFSVEKSRFGGLHAQFYPNQCNVLPLRCEIFQNRRRETASLVLLAVEWRATAKHLVS